MQCLLNFISLILIIHSDAMTAAAFYLHSILVAGCGYQVLPTALKVLPRLVATCGLLVSYLTETRLGLFQGFQK